jgi:hypothetical protein
MLHVNSKQHKIYSDKSIFMELDLCWKYYDDTIMKNIPDHGNRYKTHFSISKTYQY